MCMWIKMFGWQLVAVDPTEEELLDWYGLAALVDLDFAYLPAGARPCDVIGGAPDAE